jgi:hypothetical protein
VKSKSVSERFWSKVDAGSFGSCWLWKAARNAEGRAMFHLGDRMHNASRIAWSLHNGLEFPEGKYACHSCDNPLCVNPHHIWPGSPSENSKDAEKKGRVKIPKFARNRGLTHCKWGHEFSLENTYIERDGSRACRKCDRKYAREAYIRKKRAS